MSSRGKKHELILRLTKAMKDGNATNPPAPVAKRKVPDGECKCKCGTSQDDGLPMLECIKCGAWSHISCYGLSEDMAKKPPFQCQSCVCPNANDLVVPDDELTSDPIAILQGQVAKLVRSFNAQLLSIRDDLSRLKGTVDSTINTKISAIHYSGQYQLRDSSH